MRWRVKLNRTPKHRLTTTSCKPLDPADTAQLQNIQEHAVSTPSDGGFDSSIQVQLTLKQDGTATPRFIHRTGRSDEEIGGIGRRRVAIE